MKTSSNESALSKEPPFISLILPFEPKMNRPQALSELLESAACKEEKELMTKYPEEKIKPLIKKLRKLIGTIKSRSDEKSIYILISKKTEKVYYFTPSKALPHKYPFHLKISKA